MKKTAMSKIKLPENISDILIVCAGNVCRSPMAEAALRAKLYERGIEGIRVHSAGTMGGAIPFATPEAIKTAEQHGLDIYAHRSRGLSQPMLEQADLILVLDKYNLDWILRRWPNVQEKIFLITAFRLDHQSGADVPDPYQLPMEYYQSAFDLIDSSLDEFVAFFQEGRETAGLHSVPDLDGINSVK